MSASAFNQCLTVLQDAFALAIKHGMIYRDPSATVSRMSPPPKRLELPTKQQFNDLATAIGKSGAAQAKDCEFLVRFLASSGTRISEAAACTWDLVDWSRESMHVPGEKTRSSRRDIPLFPALAALLQSVPVEKRTGPICPVKETQKSLTAACAKLGIKRLTHHDLRHLFATTCIESGVDIPTVSRWLGHSDGGALAMRTYGHLRSEHSNRMAQLVTL
jgi:integrase